MQNDNKDTEIGLSLSTLDAMQQHRKGEDTEFHPSLGMDYQRPETDPRIEDLSKVIGGLLLVGLALAYAFSGNL